MARAFTAFCCFIVGLQLLIGVPVAVCTAFLALFGGLGPIAIEVHPLGEQAPQMFVHGATIPPPGQALVVHGQDARATEPQALTIAPPPNVIPPARAASSDNPILETRDQQGSPLSGTVFTENMPPDVERNEFVAALHKVAAQTATESPSPKLSAPDNVAACTLAAGACCEAGSSTQQTDQLIVQHLYEMAEIDERAGNFERADEWRARAREIRQPVKESPVADSPTERSSSASAKPPSLDLP